MDLILALCIHLQARIYDAFLVPFGIFELAVQFLPSPLMDLHSPKYQDTSYSANFLFCFTVAILWITLSNSLFPLVFLPIIVCTHVG